MLVDAHHHFWRYSQDEYGWIDDSLAPLKRDFLPEHLREEIEAAGVQKVISVQARQTIGETEWLLDLARQSSFVGGVVGWIPLIDPAAPAFLELFAADLKFKGVRHVLQAEPDDRYMLRDDFNQGIRELLRHKLIYEILILERQLAPAIEFVDRHPNQLFILDHIAKPRIRDGVMSPWRENLRELARRPHVFCKLSGVVTEADPQRWTEEQLQPYLETVLDAFGPQRLMFGTDWPVCLVATSYRDWFDLVSRFTSQLSPGERARVLGGTAVEAYGV